MRRVRRLVTRASSAKPQSSLQMKTATTGIVRDLPFFDAFILTTLTLQARKRPPAKKAKKGSAGQSSAKSSRHTKSLSLLPAMPLDILFEVKKKNISLILLPTANLVYQVFSRLTPKDIIHLSRTSRTFRDTLMTRNATFVWKAARERFGAPECPMNMSEPQWAVLLFGNNCQVRKRSSPVMVSRVE